MLSDELLESTARARVLVQALAQTLAQTESLARSLAKVQDLLRPCSDYD